MIHQHQAQSKNPWIVYGVHDMVAIFGLGFWIFVGLQAASAAIAGRFACDHLDCHMGLFAGGLVCLMFLLDGIVFAFLKGRHYRAFIRPAMIVALFTIVPSGLLWAGHFIYDLTKRI
ncbi:MAG: hypothetical protein MUF13_12915 [Akkermansiaceae bacterium]|jgi:hypothetical protein|nr:hypothetical protein [Akkermansiaceae bacterium]